MITLQFILALLCWITIKAAFTSYWSAVKYKTVGHWRFEKFKRCLREQLTVKT